MNRFVQILRKALTKIGIQESNKLVWGYGYNKSEVDKEITEYYHAAKVLRDQELVGYTCLTEKELESIKSGIGRVTGVQCSESEYDYTKETRPDKDLWIAKNPNCVAYEYYADYIAAQCKLVSIDFQVVKRECENVGINLDVRRQEICEAIELAIEVKEQKCDVDIDVQVDMQKCIIDFETVVVPQKCDIDFKTFVYKISCGATLETVVEELNCSANVNISVGVADEDCATDYPCSVEITCGTVAECDYFPEGVDERVAAVEVYNNSVALPTINGYCDPCGAIHVSNGQWTATWEQVDIGTSRVIGEWEGNTLCECYGQEGIEVKACFAFGLEEACYNDCGTEYSTCNGLCLGDEECLAACTADYSTCLNVCLDGHQLPSYNMCACGYTASFVTNVVDDSAVRVECDGGLNYIDYTATITDSLGNTKNCIYRRYNANA